MDLISVTKMLIKIMDPTCNFTSDETIFVYGLSTLLAILFDKYFLRTKTVGELT